MVTSVPEKTLEHWAGMYLTYRYRSHAGLWWPTVGEDIAVRHLPSTPGKIVQLEIKTLSHAPATPNEHSIMIELAQLCAYLRRPVGLQPFYVFPRADWAGVLANTTLAAGEDPSEHAFSRSSSSTSVGWFAKWTYALTSADVASTIGLTPCSGACSCGNGQRKLVRFVVGAGGTTSHWHRSAPVGGPALIPWRTLWSDLQSCGEASWPQTFLLPRDPVLRSLTRATLLAYLRQVRVDERWRSTDANWGPMVPFVSDGEGRVTPVELDDLEPVSANELATGVHLAAPVLDP